MTTFGKVSGTLKAAWQIRVTRARGFSLAADSGHVTGPARPTPRHVRPSSWFFSSCLEDKQRLPLANGNWGMSGAQPRWKLSHTHGPSRVFPMTKGHMKRLGGPFLKPVPEWLGLQRCSDRPQPYSPTSLRGARSRHPGQGPGPPHPQQQITRRRLHGSSLLTFTCPDDVSSLFWG